MYNNYIDNYYIMYIMDSEREQKYIILPTEYHIEENKEQLEKCAVLVHLYYMDTILFYMEKINRIPEEIHVFFTYSDEKVRKLIEQYLTRDNYSFIYKDNRGRDVSALLVGARKEILHYEYFCFLHDKKEKTNSTKDDTRKWISFLWENTLANEHYIYNIISLMEKNKQLGVVAPPFFLSEINGQAYIDTWGNNKDNVKKLLEQLQIKYDFNDESETYTLGTVFWARTTALSKLLNYNWYYEDFEDEPLPIDGTLSHAIERAFFFIAREAGYQGKYVMTDQCASEYIFLQQEGLKSAFDILKKELLMTKIKETKEFPTNVKELCNFAQNNKHVYIYGFGKIGKLCYKLLRENDIAVDGFVISKKSDSDRNINCDIPIYEVDELILAEEDGIIVAVGLKLQREILQNIQKYLDTDNIFVFRRQ